MHSSKQTALMKKIFRRPDDLLMRHHKEEYRVDVMKVDSYEDWYTLDGLVGELFVRLDGKKSLETHLAALEKQFETPKDFQQKILGPIDMLLKESLIVEIK
jgi:hypothetical protein